jgi:hypothetical protein
MRSGWIWPGGLYIVATLILIGIAVWHRSEGFADAVAATPAAVPDLGKTVVHIQEMLSRFASPEMLSHITSIAGKDPGELARMHIASQKAAAEKEKAAAA